MFASILKKNFASGLVEIEKELNGETKTLKPFPPGTFEEYDILESGKVKFVRSQRYFLPGDKPGFKPFVPYEGTNTNQTAF